MPYRICLISLGCAKNQVNSEQMLYLLNQAGHEVVGEVDGCDVAIVNTCGFIDSAKSEAIDQILQLAEVKKAGGLKKILVTGCLSQRYENDILESLPEVDGMLGTGSFGQICQAVEDVMHGGKPLYFGDKSGPIEEIGRVVTTGPGWAYLRIAEGCDNWCAFCANPAIRGRYRSRALDAIVQEARDLAVLGVKELIVIAQDITRWGTDLYGKPSLALLLRELAKIDGIRWIRLHYLYPEIIDDELIDLIANEGKIVKYLDIPIQHINNDILRRMNRHCTGDEIRALLQKLRARIPGLVLRTSLITGLPGEGEAERGFSYMQDAPLDMRMDRSAPLTARDVINDWSYEELRRILYEYGEERYAPVIAKHICRAREQAPIERTGELVEIIKSAMPPQALREKQHPAKRSFQALRIAVNGELHRTGGDGGVQIGGLGIAVVNDYVLTGREAVCLAEVPENKGGVLRGGVHGLAAEILKAAYLKAATCHSSRTRREWGHRGTRERAQWRMLRGALHRYGRQCRRPLQRTSQPRRREGSAARQRCCPGAGRCT